MRISPINNTAFGRVRVRRTPINHSYIGGFINNNNEVLNALDDSLSKINVKTGNKLVDFSVDLKVNPEKKNQYWVLTISDFSDAKTLSEVNIDRNADTKEYIEQIKLLSLNIPKSSTLSSVRELIAKYQ